MSRPDRGAPPWWRQGVVYQVYPRSFADGNGDGTGDIAGVRARLGYLRDLGVDAIWLNPWYRSPLLDGGYDVADYREINEQFGTIADAEQLIAEAADHGIRVVVDLVPNHTSWEHVWFVEARNSPPGHPSRGRYHFVAGTGEHGQLPPNNWRSVFGGPAWSRLDDGEWYLHLFNDSQPDVNWEHPDVADEFESVMRFWLDRGVAGFRIDVAHGLAKAPGYPDTRTPGLSGMEAWYPDHPFWDRDEIHPIVRRWRRVLDEYGDDRMMVAEAWVIAERLANFLRPDEYHQAFDFDLLSAAWSAPDFREIIVTALAASGAVGSTSTWVLSNHDVVRHATRYGLPNDIDPATWLLDGPHDALDAALGQRRARAAALLTFALPGAVYVYQGDELGLPEVWDLPTDVLDDPVWEQSRHTRKGRDGCRVPIPWTPDGPSFGFGDGPGWLPQPPEFGPLSTAAQADDPDSMLHLYRRALALRRELFVGTEAFELYESAPDVIDFDRAGTRVTINMGEAPVQMPPGRVLLSSGPVDGAGELPPDTIVWLATT